jgi:hypothetical protein
MFPSRSFGPPAHSGPLSPPQNGDLLAPTAFPTSFGDIQTIYVTLPSSGHNSCYPFNSSTIGPDSVRYQVLFFNPSRQDQSLLELRANTILAKTLDREEVKKCTTLEPFSVQHCHYNVKFSEKRATCSIILSYLQEDQAKKIRKVVMEDPAMG